MPLKENNTKIIIWGRKSTVMAFFFIKIWINLAYNINRIQSQHKWTHSDTKYAYVTTQHI